MGCVNFNSSGSFNSSIKDKKKYLFSLYFLFISFYFILFANYEILIPHKILTSISRHSSFAFGIFIECHNSSHLQISWFFSFQPNIYIWFAFVCMYRCVCVCVNIQMVTINSCNHIQVCMVQQQQSEKRFLTDLIYNNLISPSPRLKQWVPLLLLTN